MPQEFAQFMKRQRGRVLVTVLAGSMGWAVYNGTRNARQLFETHEEIQQLREQNAILRNENKRRREQIERIEKNPSQQELEIRKQNLVKPGEHVYMLPENEQKAAETPETQE